MPLDRKRAAIATTLLGLVAAGCTASPTATGKSPHAASVGSPSPAVVGLIDDASPAPAGKTSAAPGTPAATAAVALSGVVTGPAELLGDAGSALIGKTKLHLLSALTQVPLAGARVTVFDAAGHPVYDSDGNGLVAVADALGRYTFAKPLPPRNLMLSVEFGDRPGRLAALAPPATPQVDVDFVSTLTTTYILDRYVAGQADPLATLERLPAEVERSTRDVAALAFANGSVALPDDLTAAKVTATVDRLRAADQALDDQLEIVRRLLVAAGLTDLGDGRLATEVALRSDGMAVGSDGRLYLNAYRDRRVWRVSSDGRLATAAGSGTPAKAIDGLAGAEAGLASVAAIAADEAGGLLILESAEGEETAALPGGNGRLTRLAPGGRLHVLAEGLVGAVSVFPGAAGEALVITHEYLAKTARLWSFTAGRAPLAIKSFTGDDADRLATVWGHGRDAKGDLYMELQDPSPDGFGFSFAFNHGLYRLTAAGRTLERLQDLTLGTFALDGAANLFTFTDGTLAVQPPGGTPRTLCDQVDPALLPRLRGAVLAPDGTAYAGDELIYRVQGGKLTHVAGTTAAGSSAPGVISLGTPQAVTVNAAGELIIAELGIIRKVGLDQQQSVVIGTGTVGFNGADIYVQRGVRLDEHGIVHFIGQGPASSYDQPISTVEASGDLSSHFYQLGTRQINDFLPLADGSFLLTAYAWDAPNQNPRQELLHVNIFQAPEVLVEEPGTGSYALARGADGTIYLSGGGKLRTWSAEAGLQLIKADPLFTHGNELAPLAVDARGRAYVARHEPPTVSRFDPATGATKVIAGAGGTHFTGSGVDDSLKRPQSPVFDAKGTLYFCDSEHRQIKYIPAAELQ